MARFKYAIEDIQALAREKGGECLSEVYLGVTVKHHWRCGEGHEWWSAPHNMKSKGRWCPECAGNARGSIEKMRGLAEARGGKCLSEEYVDNRTHLRWKCKLGHEWRAKPNSITNGTWCPECSVSKKLDIGQMRELAESRGGECLSSEYGNAFTKLRWRCSIGHTWVAAPYNVKHNETWCPECSNCKKLDIEQMRALAKSRGGECLSAEYANSTTKLLWECAAGHKWTATANSVRNSSTWCPECSVRKKLDIEVMQMLAERYGGRCLSEEYTNAHTKLLWECSDGHRWWAMPASIKNSSTWCPHCRYKNEQECRGVFEALTGKAFPKCRPKWLEGLELDGYCEDLGVAFEYNGKQHYEVIAGWHKNGEQDLETQKARDMKKARLCETNWVVLIVIPYSMKDKDIFIGRELADIFG